MISCESGRFADFVRPRGEIIDATSDKGQIVQFLKLSEVRVATNSQPKVPTPRWVKVNGALVVLLMLAVIAMSTGLLGRHGQSEGAPLHFIPSSHDQHMRRQ